MMSRVPYSSCLLACLLLLLPWAEVAADEQLAGTIEQIKPALVGVGTFQKTRSPAARFLGTGFAVGDGLHIVTNAHVFPDDMEMDQGERMVAILAHEDGTRVRGMTEVGRAETHDLVLLRLDGDESLPTLSLGDSEQVREGERFAFTGFPLGMALGYSPVTHEGIVSAITPAALPALHAQGLDAAQIRRLRNDPYEVFQLDANAYPGNSGSPLYHPETAMVIGVVNKVFIQQTRETALERPSGITYAIPSRFVRDLLETHGVPQ